MNNVKLLHINCCFFQFFNSQVALKNLKKFAPPPKKKLKWRYCHKDDVDGDDDDIHDGDRQNRIWTRQQSVVNSKSITINVPLSRFLCIFVVFEHDLISSVIWGPSFLSIYEWRSCWLHECNRMMLITSRLCKWYQVMENEDRLHDDPWWWNTAEESTTRLIDARLNRSNTIRHKNVTSRVLFIILILVCETVHCHF